MLDHTLRLTVQGVSWQALDLQEERLSEVARTDTSGIQRLHQTDEFGDLFGRDGEACLEEQIILDLLDRACQIAVVVNVPDDVACDLAACPLQRSDERELLHQILIKRRGTSREGDLFTDRLALL